MKCFFNILLLALCSLMSQSIRSQQNTYHVSKTFHIASPGGWDYLAVNGKELYVSHGDQVNILDKNTGDSIGMILHTNGVHGIAFIPSLDRGYISNGKLNSVTVFALSTHKTLAQVPTGKNPDAILYEPFSKTIITCNGGTDDLSLIDPSTYKVVATIAVGGRPETAVTDGMGKLFVNIEDKSEIVSVELEAKKVVHRWAFRPAQGPTGLAYDRLSHRLFAGCDHLLVVLDAVSGKLVDTVTIGDGCDGVAFDEKTQTIFTSNGEGTVSVISELSADRYRLAGTITTKKGARTIAIDSETQILYLPTADLQTASAPNTRPAMIPGTFQVLVLEK